MAAQIRIAFPDADAHLAALITGERLDRLKALGTVEIREGRPRDAVELLDRIRGAAGVILGWDLAPDVMREAAGLKVVSYLGTGVAKFVDLGLARELGITVCNVPGYGDNAVAEHTLALLLAVVRKVALLDRQMHDGHWKEPLPAIELRGRTIGIIGLGGIGARMAVIANGLGMRVLSWTRKPSPAREAAHGVRFVELDALLRESEIVSLHLALTPETRQLLDARRLDLLKPGAVIVNTARAELVDEAALIERLNSGRIAGAGIDVFTAEPLPKEHLYAGIETVVLTPHVAYNTTDAAHALLDIAIKNLTDYFAGKPSNAVTGTK
jgi:D-3-phosphoglycerate dehydrogenase